MSSHDPLFKRLLRTFFADFLRIVSPELARRLNLTAPVFLDKEFSSGSPANRSRVVDLLVEVPLRPENGKSLLVHVEIEARARHGMGERLREYHRRIQARHEGEILSIVLYLRGGRAGVREETLEGDLTGPGFAGFRYLAFGIAGCKAAESLATPEPLAWALASLMDRGSWTRAEHKLFCLRRIAAARLSDEERFELLNCVETYLQLVPEEAADLAALNAGSKNREIRAMEITWADRMIAKGQELGRKEGAQKVLLSLLTQRFGAIPKEVRQRVKEIDSVPQLTRLATKVLKARSLEDMKLV